MKIVKLRVWDPDEKIMYYPNEYGKYFYQGVWVFLSSDNWFIEDDLGNNDIATFNLDKCQIMQFTGLYDKNDKEIWEKDVLYDKYSNLVNQLKRTECLSREEFKKVEVFWDTEMGRWGVGNKLGVSSLEFVKRDSEVIGNVCEHPELIS